MSTGNKAKDSEETRRELSVNIGLSFIREHTNTSVRLGPVHMIPLSGTSRLPMNSPRSCFPIKIFIVFSEKASWPACRDLA